jgi:hypothetical protein
LFVIVCLSRFGVGGEFVKHEQLTTDDGRLTGDIFSAITLTLRETTASSSRRPSGGGRLSDVE